MCADGDVRLRRAILTCFWCKFSACRLLEIFRRCTVSGSGWWCTSSGSGLYIGATLQLGGFQQSRDAWIACSWQAAVTGDSAGFSPKGHTMWLLFNELLKLLQTCAIFSAGRGEGNRGLHARPMDSLRALPKNASIIA